MVPNPHPGWLPQYCVAFKEISSDLGKSPVKSKEILTL